MKNRILGIFCLTIKNQNLNNEVCIFILFSHHGMKRDWYRHNWAQWFGYLGQKSNIWRQKSVTLWQLSQCHNSNYHFFSIFWYYKSDLLLWQVSLNNSFTLVKRFNTRKCAKLIFESLTLWQLSQCHNFQIFLCSFIRCYKCHRWPTSVTWVTK